LRRPLRRRCCAARLPPTRPPTNAPRPLQAARQAAAQLESQLAAAREAARLELAAEQRRQAAALEALRKELQQAKQERNLAEYQRDVLRDQLDAAAAAAQQQQQQQQQQRPGAQLGRAAALVGLQQGQPAPWQAASEEQHWEEAGAHSLPHSGGTAQQLLGASIQLAPEAAAAADDAGGGDGEEEEEAGEALELLGAGGEEVPALSPGISRPGHGSRPLAAPRFAGKSGVPSSFMGVGSFSRGSIIRQGPDGRGGQAKVLAPITNTAKRAPSAFVSSSGAAAKKSKHAKLGAAAGTASIQSFFGRAAG
jgi:hypothetical protein